MTGRRLRFPARNFAFAGLAAVMTVTGFPAHAQDSGAENRIRKLEAEVRALQRRVFPGADGRFFEPEVTTQPQSSTSGPALPSTTAVTDILARLDALESQIQRLTGQYEESSFAVRQLTSRVEALEAAPGGGVGAAAGGAVSGTPAAQTPSARSPSAGTTPAASGSAPARPSATGPSAERLAAVRAIAKPQTDDAGDDEYSYGFRLWDAGYYPEAIQQLTMFVEKYPSHSRATYGRNLLGRAYLDDGKPNDAAPWFLRNYQADKNAARAGDSLLYLAEAMIALGDTNRACIALSEFAETYPALATGRLQTAYAANRAKVTCN